MYRQILFSAGIKAAFYKLIVQALLETGNCLAFPINLDRLFTVLQQKIRR